MPSRFFACLALTAGFFLGGCATNQMAFSEDSEKLADKTKPIFLLSVSLKNSFKPSYPLALNSLQIEKGDGKNQADKLMFAIDAKADRKVESSQGDTAYLLRMELDPGSYQLRSLHSLSRGFLIVGSFFTPLNMPLAATAKGVYYLGNVNAVVRERKGSEFRAGPVIPLIDQAVVGAAGGSYEVEVKDLFEADVAAFKAQFPALAGAEIKKAILPAFDRVNAQKLWEAN